MKSISGVYRCATSAQSETRDEVAHSLPHEVGKIKHAHRATDYREHVDFNRECHKSSVSSKQLRIEYVPVFMKLLKMMRAEVRTATWRLDQQKESAIVGNLVGVRAMHMGGFGSWDAKPSHVSCGIYPTRGQCWNATAHGRYHSHSNC